MAKKVAKKAAKAAPKKAAKKAAPAKLTQAVLITKLAEANDLSKAQVKTLLKSLAEMVVKETKKNGIAILPGFGRLVKSARKARKGRNPATGEAIRIRAKTVVKFRVAKACKDAVVPPRKK